MFREDILGNSCIDDILGVAGRLRGARIVGDSGRPAVRRQSGARSGALRDLELFGFVVSSPFRGTQVRKISSGSARDLSDSRGARGVARERQPSEIDDGTLGQVSKS